MLLLTFVTIFVTQSSLAQDTSIPTVECISGSSTSYNGTRDYTYRGIPCQRWDVNEPHNANRTPRDGGHHNYCRNPDGDLRGTWCYTTNATVRWDYCKIPKCPDSSALYWTTFDRDNMLVSIISTHADPEVVKEITDETGTFNLSVLVNVHFQQSEFWALTSNAERNSLFYSNYKQEYVGIYDVSRNITRRVYNGMAYGIENMAYDRISTNLYWSDSTMKWIMASDTTTFDHYTPIYRSEDPIYGIAIHYKLRQLYFSTYKAVGSKIITTNLAGENETILFQYPDVLDVTGMTIDYEQDRLYWTDFTGNGGSVVSSRMDGSNRTQLHYRAGAIFWGITIFSDYLYVTDVNVRTSANNVRSYSVWIVNKQSSNEFRYRVTGKPRGITVINEKDRLPYKVPSDGECSSMPRCDHICLPRINATRECACSIGYQKTGNTSCTPRIIEDSFLLVSDSAQQRIFKIPINYNENDYSIAVAPENSRNVAAVAVYIQSQTLYWSNNETGELTELPSSGSNLIKHDTNHTVKSIVADPRTGNIFFVDSSLQRIYVMSADGRYKKAIMIPTDTEAQSIRIQMIAQDYVNRKIYWSDSGMGQVWRMDLDGMNKEIVFENLNSPQAITIDHKRGSLFVVESRDAIIYEVSLTSIHVITSTSIQGQRYDLSRALTRTSYQIVDIKVHDDILYFVDQKTNSVERFNLTIGSSSAEAFGPPDFFRLTSLAILNTNYFDTYIANITSPCETTLECRHICVDKSDSLYSCLCDDLTDERECLNVAETTTSYAVETTNIQTTEEESTTSYLVETTNIQRTEEDCIIGSSTSYNGTRDYTYRGILCQRWDVNVPHKPRLTPNDGGHHNYCRNPDGDLRGTWCFTTNASVRWQYCKIPKCRDNSALYWTNFDRDNMLVSIVSTHADPEIVKEITDETGIFNTSAVVEAQFSSSEVWALTSSVYRNELFYSNFRQNYVGIHLLSRNITRRVYNGMAHGIENMAYDRVSTNLYWSDSTMKWIMASDTSTFDNYASIYRSEDPIYGLAIHYKLRRLYISTYKAVGSKIITTNLAGENETIIFQFPDIFDVTGMTIDYEQDRLYWTDYRGHGSLVASCKMDGSNRTQLYNRAGAIFWGISIYSDYLYVTDVHPRYSITDNRRSYSVWILNKQRGNVFRYTVTGKPRGITVINEKDRLPYEDGECSTMPRCDHICLPRINATRQCACSLGYQKIGDTSCIPRLIEDNFLFVSDSAQQRIFKIPFNYNESDYSIAIPPENSRNVAAVAVNIQSQTLYWSNNETGELTESSSSGSNLIKHDTNHTVKSIVADPRTGNIFFVDSSLQRVYVMSADGRYKKAIMIPTDTEAQSIRIQMIAQDYVNRKIYWSDLFMGRVWRMDLDGMNKEIVFENLNSPQAITIDHKRGSLFVVESSDAIIYEVSFTSIHVIENTLIQGQRYDLSQASHRRISYQIVDIKVRDDILYFIDQASNTVWRFNLTVGLSSTEEFGPPDFFALSSLAISNTNYYETYIANISSSCETISKCKHICVDKSDSSHTCLCDDATDERECFNVAETTTSYVDETDKQDQMQAALEKTREHFERILEIFRGFFGQ